MRTKLADRSYYRRRDFGFVRLKRLRARLIDSLADYSLGDEVKKQGHMIKENDRGKCSFAKVSNFVSRHHGSFFVAGMVCAEPILFNPFTSLSFHLENQRKAFRMLILSSPSTSLLLRELMEDGVGKSLQTAHSHEKDPVLSSSLTPRARQKHSS